MGVDDVERGDGRSRGVHLCGGYVCDCQTDCGCVSQRDGGETV